MPENLIKINLIENGRAVLRTAGKICLSDIEVLVDVPSVQMPAVWDESFVFVAEEVDSPDAPNAGSSISLMHEFEEFDPIVISGITEGMTWRDLAEVNDDVCIDDYTDYESGSIAVDYAVSYYYEGSYYYIYQCGPGTYVQPDDIITINDDSYFYNDISPSM